MPEKRTPVLMKMSNRLNQNGRSFGLECPFVWTGMSVRLDWNVRSFLEKGFYGYKSPGFSYESPGD